jgi:transcriptional regulator with XRE-family HTH domain
MAYAVEKLSHFIKAARERLGWSQSELSSASGVPQSHISKIETKGLNMTVSSLTAIANALDLELVLIPRKAAPAIKQIVRGFNEAETSTTREAQNELIKLKRELDALEALDPEKTQSAQRKVLDLQQVRRRLQRKQVERIRRLRRRLLAQDDVDITLNKTIAELTAIREQAQNNPTPETQVQPKRGAYSLEDDDND